MYSLLKHDAIEIIYQPITDADIIKLDRWDDDICHSSGIYQDEIHLKGIGLSGKFVQLIYC